MSATTGNDETIERLSEEFPDWRIWRGTHRDGGPGELMATRRRDLTDEELHAGLCRTLPMGYPADLRAQLVEQTRRERTRGGL